jgi:threonine/homoserine/homoserine lactone efflux protein
LSGGKRAGIASTFGTALGGLVHVIAGGLGVSLSSLPAPSCSRAQIRWRALSGLARLQDLSRGARSAAATGRCCRHTAGVREGVLVEAPESEDGGFFLAFIPQFIDPAGYVALQFIALGLISVALNTLADVVVVMMAATRAPV